MAKVDYFLKIDEVPGESQDVAQRDSIELESWHWGEFNAGSFATGSGGGAGKVAMQDFNFVMLANRASASLARACAGGTTFKQAILTCRKAGATPQVFLQIWLGDVLVSGFRTGVGGHGGVVPADEVSLNFAQIRLAYGKQDANGKVNALDQKFGYDLKQCKPI
jgi:type VI secretion system secreted protein Hcp